MLTKLKLSSIFAVSTLLLGLALSTTHPAKVSLTLVMAPFLLMFVSLASALLLVISIRRDIARQHLVLAVVIGALPVVLLVMKSIGQLGVKDIIIAASLLILGWVYITRVNFQG